MTRPLERPYPVAWSSIAAIVVAVAAAAVYVHFANWPPGTQPDEIKKAAFILSGTQDSRHPILMLQISRLANLFLGFTEPPDVLRLGRIFAAIFGGLTVFATYFLGRLVLAPWSAVAAAAAVAVTPLVAVHATFLKEDIFLTAPAIMGLAALLVLVARPNKPLAVAAGIAFGLAVSAKLVGVLFLAYAVVVLLAVGRHSLASRGGFSLIMTTAAVATFILINAPALMDTEIIHGAMTIELGRAVAGSTVPMPIWMTGGMMHLRQHLVPWLGLPLTVLGIAGLLSPFVDRQRRTSLAIIAGATVLWYVAHEISPLKAPRYMVPAAPLLVVLGGAFVEAILGKRSARWAPAIASAALLLAAAPAAYNSYRILISNEHDPRRVMADVIVQLGPQLLVDPYALYNENAVERINRRLDRSRPPAVLATANFFYDRFEPYGSRPSQNEATRSLTDFYRRAFQHPYLEFSSGWPSYKYINPVIRIVSLDDDVDRLMRALDAALAADPELQITVGPPSD